MPKLYLIRHGQTFLNQLNRMQGWVDSLLSKRGIYQAKMLGQNLAKIHFKAIYSSDLGRARQTSQLISQEMAYQGPITYTSNLRETNFGSFDALPIKDVWNEITENTPFQNQNDIIADGGMKEVRTLMLEKDPKHWAESYQQVIGRWQKFLQEIGKMDFDDTDKILVITHGTFLRTVFEQYGANIMGNQNAPQNCSLNILNVKNGQLTMTAYNQQL